jgi:phosphomannomutase
MLYFASTKLPVDVGIMITASHNPSEYNGIKICLKNATPVGLETGLSDIRDICMQIDELDSGVTPNIKTIDISAPYYAFLATFANFGDKRFRIVTDTANAMGILELPLFRRFTNIEHVGILHASLGFPSPHEANPLKTETLIELQYTVRRTRSDIGIAYDGDADRVGFVDERGHVIPADIILALLAKSMSDDYPKIKVLYDQRSSQSVRETVEALGGTAIESRVGHAHIKKAMREHGAVLAGELAGHYYFSEGGYIAEMGSLPVLLILNLMAKEQRPLSHLVADVQRYFHSGEINFEVAEYKKLFDIVELKYKDGTLTHLDGVKVVFPDWWFSIRASNTEPLVRLNLEATSKELMEEKLDELTSLIKKYS